MKLLILREMDMSKDLDFIDTFLDRKKPVKNKDKDSEEQSFDDESGLDYDGLDYEIDYTVQE